MPKHHAPDHSTPPRREFSGGWSPAEPGQARTKHETLRVVYRESLRDVIYALDAEGNRYFLDKDTAVNFQHSSVTVGQVIDAFVNDEGYVLEATIRD